MEQPEFTTKKMKTKVKQLNQTDKRPQPHSYALKRLKIRTAKRQFKALRDFSSVPKTNAKRKQHEQNTTRWTKKKRKRKWDRSGRCKLKSHMLLTFVLRMIECSFSRVVVCPDETIFAFLQKKNKKKRKKLFNFNANAIKETKWASDTHTHQTTIQNLNLWSGYLFIWMYWFVP